MTVLCSCLSPFIGKGSIGDGELVEHCGCTNSRPRAGYDWSVCMQARLDITAENLKRIEKEEKKAARRGSLRVSGSGDSRTTSETSMDQSGQHTAFGGDIDASNKAGLSSMLSRLSFRRPH